MLEFLHGCALKCIRGAVRIPRRSHRPHPLLSLSQGRSKNFLLVGRLTFLFPFLSFLFPVSFFFSFFPFSFAFFLLFSLKVGRLKFSCRGLRKRCKLLQLDLGRRPGRNRIWCILVLKCDIWWQQVKWFSWELTDQVPCSLHSKGQSGTKRLSSVVYAGFTQRKKQNHESLGGSVNP